MLFRSQKNYCKRQKRGGKYKSFKEWLNENELDLDLDLDVEKPIQNVQAKPNTIEPTIQQPQKVQSLKPVEEMTLPSIFATIYKPINSPCVISFHLEKNL